mgnify:CR=1 FL=1
MGGNILRRARPGAAAPERRTLPAWPFLTVRSPRSPGGGITLTEKTSAAAAAADAGLVFYNYCCHLIIYEIDIENKPEPRAVRGAPLASEGRYFIELNCSICSLQWAREIIFCVVRPPKADGSGRVRPVWGRPAAHRRC